MLCGIDMEKGHRHGRGVNGVEQLQRVDERRNQEVLEVYMESDEREKPVR